MQYSKCQSCIYNGNVCKIIMTQAMLLCNELEYTINYTQTRNIKHKCQLKINYDCENFIPKKDKKSEENKNV